MFNQVSANNIVYIDLNYIFSKSKLGNKISIEIQNLKEKNNKIIESLKHEIQAQDEFIKSQKNIISKEEYSNRIYDLQEMITEYDIKVKQLNDEFLLFENNISKKYLKNIYPIMENYAKEKSIDLIIKKNQVLIGINELDISNDILKIFDKEVNNLDN